VEERVEALERTVGKHDVRLDDVERETLRTRDRVHELMEERATILGQAELTKLLAGRVNDLAGGIDAITERAVEKVLARRREEFRESWKYWLGWIIAAVTAAAFVAQHFHLHLGG
jgi:hypothetical protein